MSPRRRVDDPWPWPADTAVERARRIARAYRDIAINAEPHSCVELDEQMREWGQTWVTPKYTINDPDELLTTNEVAEYCDVHPGSVDQWRRRGLPVTMTPDGPRYLLADVLDYHAERRRRRARGGQKG